MHSNSELIQTLQKIEGLIIREQEPMRDHTSFEIGGPAQLFVIPKTEESLIESVKVLREEHCPVLMLGNGSNMLIRDGGVRGAVVSTEELKDIRVEDTCITAQAGAMMKEIAQAALSAGLTGFEFASGIPGSIGGGVRMNAGAYDGELKDVVESIRVLTPEGEVKTLTNDELDFGYRKSKLQEEDLILLSADIRLKPGEYDTIEARMNDLNARRAEKQPLEYPSAGSTFRRPPGYFAGKLIQDAGMQGVSVGGAMVSTKHAGFVINTGGATAEDVLTLIERVQRAVYEKFGVELKTEVIPIGEER